MEDHRVPSFVQYPQQKRKRTLSDAIDASPFRAPKRQERELFTARSGSTCVEKTDALVCFTTLKDQVNTVPHVAEEMDTDERKVLAIAVATATASEKETEKEGRKDAAAETTPLAATARAAKENEQSMTTTSKNEENTTTTTTTFQQSVSVTDTKPSTTSNDNHNSKDLSHITVITNMDSTREDEGADRNNIKDNTLDEDEDNQNVPDKEQQREQSADAVPPDSTKKSDDKLDGEPVAHEEETSKEFINDEPTAEEATSNVIVTTQVSSTMAVDFEIDVKDEEPKQILTTTTTATTSSSSSGQTADLSAESKEGKEEVGNGDEEGASVASTAVGEHQQTNEKEEGKADGQPWLSSIWSTITSSFSWRSKK
ncbi:hypothetical protein BDB00DRAFT_629124 [Zychaea mexicana]|uniref:uncharacterized protein n=1 Tax=Zychaea mexicana TaxID=64656 RepID=UPI0022FE4072|nr:uncharacterized protein BDB00DRAFT_629124 [Zychaea mexicana]KAI9489279.1 hypothetical protein BDB00DRAFT_629124 [Zychaea mexicana]